MTEADMHSVYKGIALPNNLYTPQSLKYLEEFSFRHDDVLVVSYPKSGTVWMQQIVTLILSEGDLTPVLTQTNWIRVPWLEEKHAQGMKLEERPSPRALTIQMSYTMLPASYYTVKPKVIYVMRNPRDVFTSFYYYHQMSKFTEAPQKEEFLAKFLDGKVIHGSWFDHVKSWLNAEDQENIMYISYEEMIQDLKDSVTRISRFLGKSLSEEVIEKITKHSTFKSMKQNKMTNYSQVPDWVFDQKKIEFLRKGIIGDWRNLLSEEEAAHFDAVYKEKMKDVKRKLPWD